MFSFLKYIYIDLTLKAALLDVVLHSKIYLNN